MKYIGVARKENGHMLMPDGLAEFPDGQTFEVSELGGDILLAIPPLDRQRMRHIEKLAKQSIAEHRTSLGGLAK